MNEQTNGTKPKLSELLEQRGISAEAWRVLCNSVFPGAEAHSILLAIDYCKARDLDVLKRPCHIVPMSVTVVYRDSNEVRSTRTEWRDVILPGIYEYRVTAHRTGEYHGHSEPRMGPEKEFNGVLAPEWCAMRGYRVNRITKEKAAYPVKVWFAEVVGLTNAGKVNSRWTRAPRQMLGKCTEAAMLRAMFPEEIGGEPTAEEIEGRSIEVDENGEIQNISGKRASRKPRTSPPRERATVDQKEPERLEAQGPDPLLSWVNARQLELLAEQLDKSGVPAKAFNDKFQVADLNELPAHKFTEALHWLGTVNAPPE